MQKVKRVFKSFADADKANRELYKSLSPSQRMDMLLTLIGQNKSVKSDGTRTGPKRIFALLNARDVRYVIVGAFALAHHGRPRYTGDIDFFVEPSPENAEKLKRVFEQFGFANIGVEQEDFTAEDQVVQLGIDPQRMDLMTPISGVAFEEAWNTREYGNLDGLQVPYISKELLKRNKAAVGRKQDLADLDYLQD